MVAEKSESDDDSSPFFFLEDMTTVV